MDYKNIEKIIKTYIIAMNVFFIIALALNVVLMVYRHEIIIYSLIMTCLFYIYFRIQVKMFDIKLVKQVVTYEEEVNKYKKEANIKSPIPYMIVDIHGTIKWTNNKFKQIVKHEKPHGENISNIFPSINIEDIIEEHVVSKQITLNNKIYNLDKQILKIEEDIDQIDTVIAVYLIDNTELLELRERYEDEQIAVGYFFIDNFQEVVDSTEELKLPMLLGIIERRLGRLAQDIGAIVKKIDRDRFMFVFYKGMLEYLYDTKFEILDEMRKINMGNELPVTISIGVGIGGDGLIATSEYAKEALELALGRGGDQAVIKQTGNYEFFGGKNKKDIENAITSNARARIKAFAFKELVNTVDEVFIMGHRNPDLDCLGAAIGIYRAVETLGKKAHIVLNEVTAAIEPLFKRIEDSGEYEKDTFIKTSEALQRLDKDTLVVVVDVNQPNYSEAPKLLENAKKIVLIDHHIRGEVTIENPTLLYQETYASSTCELVTHLLQYIADNVDLKEVEADALIAGITVDTKNFIFKTGVKTFEAAAYLRRNGADSTRVKMLFQYDMDSYRARAEAIRNTEIYKVNYAISVLKPRDDSDYMTISQLADELLSITGVKASFVLCQHEPNKVIVSMRSLGEINVEIIAEKLGGGGHFTASGVQIKSSNTEEIQKAIKLKIDEYIKGGEKE